MTSFDGGLTFENFKATSVEATYFVKELVWNLFPKESNSKLPTH